MSRASYHRDYYQKHREEILERRRKRYAEDPDYKERVLKVKRMGPRVKRDWQHSLPFVGRRAYPISETAKLLGVHRSTLLRWIKKGLLPYPIFCLYTEQMIFTADMIVIVRDALLQFEPGDPGFRAQVERLWLCPSLDLPPSS